MSRPPPDPVFTLRGHSGEVTSLSFLDNKEDAPFLLSASSTGELFIWDLQTYRVCQKLDAHENQHILWVDYYKNHILSQGREGTVNIWTCYGNKWKTNRSILAPTIGFCHCDISKDTDTIAVPGKNSSQIDLIDFETGHIISTLTPSTPETYGMCMCVKFFKSTRNDLFLLCGYENGKVLMWDTKQKRELSNMVCHKEPVFNLDFDSKLKQQGVTCSSEQDLCIFSIDEFLHLKEQKRVSLPSAGTSSVAIRNDGKILASGGWDGVIRIFSWKTTKPLAYLNFHKSTINCLKFYHGESGKYAKLLAAGSKDKRITLWSIYSDK